MSDYDSDRAPGQGFTTVQLHHGQSFDSDHRARAPPIYASTSFAFKSAEHGAKLFALQELGPIYTRIMNPTAHVLEYRLAKLEGSGCNLDGAHPSAVATASGVSAQLHALLTICQSGDSIIAAGDLYGGTYAQFKHTFPLMGITVKFINGQNLDELISKVTAIDTNDTDLEEITSILESPILGNMKKEKEEKLNRKIEENKNKLIYSIETDLKNIDDNPKNALDGEGDGFSSIQKKIKRLGIRNWFF